MNTIRFGGLHSTHGKTARACGPRWTAAVGLVGLGASATRDAPGVLNLAPNELSRWRRLGRSKVYFLRPIYQLGDSVFRQAVPSEHRATVNISRGFAGYSPYNEAVICYSPPVDLRAFDQ